MAPPLKIGVCKVGGCRRGFTWVSSRFNDEPRKKNNGGASFLIFAPGREDKSPVSSEGRWIGSERLLSRRAGFCFPRTLQRGVAAAAGGGSAPYVKVQSHSFAGMLEMFIYCVVDVDTLPFPPSSYLLIPSTSPFPREKGASIHPP